MTMYVYQRAGGVMASVLDMRDRQQQISYEDMGNAIHQHVIQKDRPPTGPDPSLIIVTHEQWASLALLHHSNGELAVQIRRSGSPGTFFGIPLWRREAAISRVEMRGES